MKFLSVLLALSLTAHAAPSDPGKAAIEFLEKVRQRKLDLEPGGDTALSAQTAGEKRRQIARRLDRMAKDLGSDPLEVGSVKLDENFAAVLVRKIGGFDPSRLQVFPVALVKRGAEWTVAPVPASFENAGAGYAIALRKRLDLLENWMLREQVVDLENLRVQAADRVRQKIEGSLTARELRGYDAKEVGGRLLAAFARQDLPAVLGFLGGLAAKLPDDWPARLRAAEQAFAAGSRAKRPWRLLTAPEVVRMVIPPVAGNAVNSISIVCLDPAGFGTASSSPRIEMIRLGLTKSADGLWRIDPPDHFLNGSEESPDDEDGEPDPETPGLFPGIFTATHPAAPQPSAELAREALVAALRNDKLPALLSLAGSQISDKACIQAARLWWLLHDPSAVRHAIPLSFKADDSAAVGIFQFFSARAPEQLDPMTFYFEKSTAGWNWTPQPATAIRGKFQEWVDAEDRRWPEQWQQSLLAGCPVWKESDVLPSPSKEDARIVVEAWLAASRLADVESALTRAARLTDPRSGSAILRNLGYEITGARDNPASPRITGIYQGKTWTAVGVKIDRPGGSTQPLYPVVRTADGCRIVVEIDLFAAGNRGRDFLNKAALERLEKSSSAASADELRALYSEHQATVARLPAGGEP